MNNHKDRQKVRNDSINLMKQFFTSGTADNYKFEFRKCPVCKSNMNSQLLKNESGFDFVKCRDCEMVYMNPILGQKIIENFYLNSKDSTAKHQLWEKSIQKLKPSTHPQLSIRYNRLLKYSNRGKLLDFGCGFGKLTDQLKFYFDEIEGIEIDPFCAKKAQQIFQFKVYDEFIENLQFDNKYDVIFNYNNIEHLINPFHTLKYLHKALKPNGIIYIECPNIKSVSSRLFKGRHHLLQSNEHLNMFSKSTMVKILKKSGFKIIEVGTRKLDININDLIMWIFKNKLFYHRCSDKCFDTLIYQKFCSFADTLLNNIYTGLKLERLKISQGSYIQIVAEKV